MRLGAQAINYETTAARPMLSFAPVLKFWQVRGARVCGIGLVGILGWMLYSLFSTPIFYVYGASITGNQAVSAREIYTASEVDTQSIFWINTTHVAERIAGLPNIKSAEVSVALPATVLIEVIERRPQLLWQVDDAVWWVDQEGTIVPPKAQVSDDMLRVIDDDRQPMEAGFQIDPTIIKGAQALRLLAPDVRIIRHTRAQGLIVATPEGWPVYLGDGSAMRAKLIVLSSLLPALRENEDPPSYIDLRDPLRPVYRLRPVIQIEQPVAPRGPTQGGPQQPVRPGSGRP
jgi:cell division protein FtsQ